MNRRKRTALIRRLAHRESMAAARMSDAIADFAELGFREFQSARALADYLAGHGFDVQFPWSHIPTAFRATRGRGRPTIGFLAEYDALPDCGARPGMPGHGCGHNLLGAGAAMAGVVTAAAMERLGKKGRVTVWGCPAEELLAGKVYMARDGAFREDDVILGWHPSSDNAVSRVGGSALDSVLFEFRGRTAHGAYADRGRSALDGVMLLDVAANYLREHVPSNVRIHMCIRRGGDAPNVVPAYASSWYFVRGMNRAEVDDVRRRLESCARGAAMATGTRLKTTRLTALYDRLENETLAEVLQEQLESFGAPRAVAADGRAVRRLGKKPVFSDGISPTYGRTRGFASSDESSVSWLAPLGVVVTACVARGTTGHHREYSAQVKLPFAHRGMWRAAETMAGAALELLASPRRLAAVRREFRRRVRGFRYNPLIPRGQPIPTVIMGEQKLPASRAGGSASKARRPRHG